MSFRTACVFDAISLADDYGQFVRFAPRFKEWTRLYVSAVTRSRVPIPLPSTTANPSKKVVNGAQAFYKKEFGIGGSSQRDTWLVGLVNSAPYLCCAFVSSPP